jgi:electron transport complex protein RnfE
MFANKNTVVYSALDGIGMGLGFTLSLTIMSVIREVFGAGSFAGISIPFMQDYKIEFLTKAPGGLLVYGLMIALIYTVTRGKAPVKTSFGCEGCPHSGTCSMNTCNREGVES